MEFFNRKEEVIDIELTSHGKQLLSRGKFKPAYYAFYDDDITYDSQYGVGEENQKDTHDRIISTPRIKPNTVYQGVDREITQNYLQKQFNANMQILSELANTPIEQTKYVVYLQAISSQIDERDSAFVPEKKKDYALPLPMGTSDLGNQKAPAWQINFMRSELENAQKIYVDGNRAVGFLKFDTGTNSAESLNGVQFTLVDASKRDYTFTFNKSLDPSGGTCTANSLLICLNVNDDASFSTTSNQIAQQVRDKINAHPILITADIPNNDGVVRLIQDAAGDIGNTTITISAPTDPFFTVDDFTQGVDPTFAPLRIPQLFVDVYYDTSVGQEQNFSPEFDPHSEILYYEDGTYVKIDKDYILLDILEKNVPYEKENFELEVYSMPMMYDKFTDFLGLSDADELNKLKFASDSRFVKFDNFLYDNVLKTSFNPDPSYSEYFFDITVDDEIQGDISSIGITQADIPINDEELCEDQ